MNKNRYKLIFSYAKGCLVPVAEFINHIQEKSTSTTDCKKSKKSYRLSPLSQAISLLLCGLSSAVLANQNVKLDPANQQTQISTTSNKVVIIDIAKPEHDGISDNRFERFNVENGAVFKNNPDKVKSELVGHLEKNPHLNQKSAEAILAQVTGKEKTTLKGGLEIAGNKADLFIINPNGVSLNGVQTFNTHRFVASSSELVDPKKGLILNVEKGTVTIEENGLSTDGLKYVDIVAKKIEQKGAIRNSKAGKNSTNITLVAGSSEYDYKANKIVSKQKTTKEDIILGGDLGAMYGNHIKFVVTDTGAGINHKGIILSEDDIQIDSRQGDVKLNTLSNKHHIQINHANVTQFNAEVKSQQLDVNSQSAVLKSNVKAENITLNATKIAIQDKGAVRAKTVKIPHNRETTLSEKGSLIAHTVEINTQNLDNKGVIATRNGKINTEKLKNTQTISAEKHLDITVKGKTPQKSTNQLQLVENGYVNLGTIQSNQSASITFSHGTDFNLGSHKLPQAKNTLTINTTNFNLENSEALQLTSNLTINTDNFNNKGVLASGQFLSVSSKYYLENKGFLGAKEGYSLHSKGHIINEGTLHSEKNAYLDAFYNITNLGEIDTKGKTTFNATTLINDVILTGNVTVNKNKQSASHATDISWSRRNSYALNADLNEFDYSDLKLSKVGRISSGNGLEFIQKNNNQDFEHQGIYNYGILNVKGEFQNNGTAQITNGMKFIRQDLVIDYLNTHTNITVHFQPKWKSILGGTYNLSGNAERTFNSINEFLHYVLDGHSVLNSSYYYTDNKEYLKDLKAINSTFLQAALVKIFGENWENQPLHQLKEKWNNARTKYIPIDFYPNHTAKILADQITGTITTIQNGEHAETGTSQKDVLVGKHSLSLPEVEFKPFIPLDEKHTTEIDLSLLFELLNNTHLFIDRSVQFKPEVKQPNPPAFIPNEEDKHLLAETDAEKKARELEEKRQAERLAAEQAEAQKREQQRLAEQRAAEEKRQAELEAKRRAEAEKRQAKLLARQKAEEEKRQAEELAKQRAAEEKHQAELLAKQQEEAKKREAELLAKQQAEAKRREAELLAQQQEEAKKRETELRAKIQTETEKRQAELLAQQKAAEAKRQAEALAKFKAEEARRQAEQLAKQRAEEEKRQAELLKQAQAEAKKREAELLAKLQAEAEQRRAELLQQQQEEEARQIREAEAQRLQKLKEYEAKLAEEKRKADELAKKRAVPAADPNRLRIDVDPLYHTRVKYIHQEDYVGANYFFNHIAPAPKEKGKVKVIGDSYFEHQFITRNIEKQVDNHLSLKYDLTDKALVKRLMDNAYATSQELKLTLGQPLTAEQKANLKEDIIWYVKTAVNGQEVLVPQVYFAQETLADAKKYQGLGGALISARQIDVKGENVQNNGKIVGRDIRLEAENKIKNKGDILAKNDVVLKGKKGVEISAKVHTDEKGNTKVEKANVIAENHVHLEADLQHEVTLDASNVKGKTGFIKGKNLNLNDAYETQTSRKEEYLQSKWLGNVGLKTESKTIVDSVGSNAQFEHLHLAIDKDVNQKGSTIDTQITTGIVKGKYNTEAGKHIEHTEKTEHKSGIDLGLIASALGFSAEAKIENDQASSKVGKGSDSSTATITGGLAMDEKREISTSLTHKNSQLNAKSGLLNVLGNADIGGVDINKSAPSDSKDSNASGDIKVDALQKNKQNTPLAKDALAKQRQALTTEEIESLMAEKDEAFYRSYKKQAKEGFTLAAGSVSSTKQKDEFIHKQLNSKIRLGLEAEAHSAVADLATSISNQVQNAQEGLKQDGTAVLQHASDIANVITGDLAGGSLKRAIEWSTQAHAIQERKDNRTHLGGKTTIIAKNGDITLNNVESDKQSEITLNAQNNINLNAGKIERHEQSESINTKFYDGVTTSCGVMNQGCSVGTITGADVNVNNETIHSINHENTLLQGKNITLSAGKDLNLEGANVEANHLHTEIEGKTNISSQQNKLDRTTESIDASASIGASVNTALSVKPTVNVGGGYGYEKETSQKVEKQSGLRADKITGNLNDVNLKGGYIVDNNNGKSLNIHGKVTHENVQDQHHQDGGNFGASVGLNERGTSQFNIRGGRSEQIHYKAEQQSTLSGVEHKAEGINQTLENATKVEQNDRYAKTKFNFEVLDLVEVGQKGIDKLKNRSKRGQNAEPSSPIYEEVAPSPYGTVGDQNADFRRQPQGSNEEAIYSEINEGNHKAKRPLPELPTHKSVIEHTEQDYAEIPARPKSADQAQFKENPIYESADSLSKVKPIDESSESANKAKRPLPELPTHKSVIEHTEQDYAEIPARPKSADQAQFKDNPIYESADRLSKVNPIDESSESANKAKRPLPELPTHKSVIEHTEQDYAEILARPKSAEQPLIKENPIYESTDRLSKVKPIDESSESANKAKRPLPELPTHKSVIEHTEQDYAEIPARPKSADQAQFKENPIYESADSLSKVNPIYESAESVAKNPENSTALLAKQTDSKPKTEDIYAQVDKSPEARRQAEERSLAVAPKPQPKVDNPDNDNFAPTLPARPELKDAGAAGKHIKTEIETQAKSLVERLKGLFHKEKPTKPATEKNGKANYDQLDDSLNLKGLIALEESRNENFDSSVLKNEKFLDEARETAKKYIPESTIKQMGNLPELDDILTEGAKKVEKRINDVVTFKPTVEEFQQIQGLVKKLPKGNPVEDTTEQANQIADALASTSKTIQKNPELKEQLKGAIETFLTESKGKNLTVEMIEQLNHGLRPDEGADRLLYKKETLTKENAVFSSPEAARLQLAQTVDFINQAKAQGIEPSVLAGLVYQRLIAYHPFAEGNGRMTRVIVNKLLLDAGYPAFQKFDPNFETQIIPQTQQGSKSASSSEVVQEFLKTLEQNAPKRSEQAVENGENFAKNPENLTARTEQESATTAPSKATPIDDKVQSQNLQEKPRGLLQQVKDKFQPIKVGKKIKDVRDSVAKFGGEVSFKFAQSKGEVFNEIIKHTETEHGACEATCAYWISKQVKNDESLWQDLYQNSKKGKKGELNKQAFEKIKKLQTEFINSGSTATQQFKFTESWLVEQGVQLKEKKIGDFSRKDEVAGTVTNTDVKALTQAILDTGNATSGVKKISINLKGGSHTVAASVKGEKVTFFDPNFGEVTFNSKAQFERWFKEAFWQKSGYAGKETNKRFFNVINYHGE